MDEKEYECFYECIRVLEKISNVKKRVDIVAQILIVELQTMELSSADLPLHQTEQPE